MPNVAGKIGTVGAASGVYGSPVASGAFSIFNVTSGHGLNSGAASMNGLELDASQFNSVYGNSDTVQPPAICLIPQIKF